jgi:ABC-type Fe3+-hydroxamate transport system substrate-binding protein
MHSVYANSGFKSNNYIISLAPNITELVFEANAQNALIGVSSYSDYPKQALNFPVISDYQTLYIEKIVTIISKLSSTKISNNSDNNNFINPQIKIFALAWKEGNPQAFEKILARYNIKTIWLSTNSTQDVLNNLAIISKLANNDSDSNHKIKALNYKLAKTIEQTQNHYKTAKYQAKSYFYPLWHKPIMTIIGDNYIDDLLAKCNVYNIFKSSKTSMINPEALLSMKPDIVIYENKEYEQLVQKYRLESAKHVSINPDILVRPTARSIQELPNICKLIRD